MRKTDPVQHIAVAFALLTRLPLPQLPVGAFQFQAKSVWAFPLVGLAVALIAGGCGLVALNLGMSAWAAAGLVIGVQIIVTGALHEDGLADCADGFWGGMDRDRRLEIMRDSRIGSYGVLALILSVGLRWAALATCLPLGWGALIAAATVSRAIMPVVMSALPHARSDGLSHAVGKPPVLAVCIGLCLAGSLAIAAMGVSALAAILAASLVAGGMGWIARSKIGGQTGDVLGATQQLAEITVLLCLSAVA